MYAVLKCAIFALVAAAASGLELGPTDIVFHLFTRQNPSLSEPLLPTVNSISSTNFFDLDKCTVFTIHGHDDSASGNFNAFMVNAHLNAQDVNLFAVDWSKGAGMYTEGLGNAHQVGKTIAQVIDIFANTFHYNPSCIRIVGVGLGGHIAGIAARTASVKIPHIVAIDPSFHGWTHNPNILNPDDADVVEVLHATAGVFGYDYPLGDIDFYPNGGTQQFGCANDISCSHTYGIAFYAESLTVEVTGGNRFVGTACESYEEATAIQCFGPRDAVFGGTEDKSSVSGIYVFRTNVGSPFAQG